MNQHVTYQKGTKRIINSWTSFAFVFFFFYIIGDLIMSWWHNAWWAWFIIVFSLFAAITTSLKSITNRSDKIQTIEADNQEASYAYPIQTVDENTSNNYEVSHSYNAKSKYCKNCGAEIVETSCYCAYCGEVV